MISIKTSKPKEVIDITETINKIIKENSYENGMLFLFCTHTTCALTTADLDEGTDLDILDAFNKIIPNLKYRHPHNPAHVRDHILSSTIGASLTIPVESATMVLGTWQRVVLIEFNGPKDRDIQVNYISSNNK